MAPALTQAEELAELDRRKAEFVRRDAAERRNVEKRHLEPAIQEKRLAIRDTKQELQVHKSKVKACEGRLRVQEEELRGIEARMKHLSIEANGDGHSDGFAFDHAGMVSTSIVDTLPADVTMGVSAATNAMEGVEGVRNALSTKMAGGTSNGPDTNLDVPQLRTEHEQNDGELKNPLGVSTRASRRYGSNTTDTAPTTQPALLDRLRDKKTSICMGVDGKFYDTRCHECEANRSSRSIKTKSVNDRFDIPGLRAHYRSVHGIGLDEQEVYAQCEKLLLDDNDIADILNDRQHLNNKLRAFDGEPPKKNRSRSLQANTMLPESTATQTSASNSAVTADLKAIASSFSALVDRATRKRKYRDEGEGEGEGEDEGEDDAYVPPQSQAGDTQVSFLAAQKRVMRENSERAKKRREEEEATFGAEKQERLQVRLARLSQAGLSRRQRLNGEEGAMRARVEGPDGEYTPQ